MENVEDIYPLPPIQAGMLFHTIRAPQSGVYVEQYTGVLEGELDVQAFRRAWQRVIDRHPALRTAFLWEGIEQPLQVVRQRVNLPFELHDWSGLHAAEFAARYQQFLRDDRTQGFELAQAPLCRVSLFQTGALEHHLVWSFHHLVSDGWSTALILRELFELYWAESGGAPPALPHRRPYRDFIAWLQQQDLAAAERYWRRALDGCSGPIQIAVGRPPDTTGRAVEYSSQTVRIDAETETRLQALAQRERLTLNTFLQGAWALLLGRLSGASEVLYGTTVAGRPADLTGVEEMIGLFINTLPMRVPINSHQHLLPWLKSIQEQQLEMRQYEHTPLTDVQRWSRIEPGTPLFETLFVFENYPLDGTEVTGPESPLKLRDVRYREQSNYPLSLLVVPGRELMLQLVYDRAAFDDDDVTRMLGHLDTLLGNMVGKPDQTLSEYSMLSEAERRQILFEWNDTAVHYPADRLIHELIQEWAAKRPNAAAIVYQDERLNYRELNEQTDRLAQVLVRAGIGPSTPVGLCLERSPQMVIAILGVLKAGGAYLPLDPGYPPDRLALMLQETRAPVVLIQSHLRDRLPTTAAQQICLDEPWPRVEPVGADADAPGRNGYPAEPVGPDDLAYIIYTSGSTGRPKGVPITHRNLVHSTLARTVYYEHPVDAFLLLSSFAFDSSVAGIFWTLCQGGALVLPRQREEQDVQALASLISRHRVSHLLCLPSLYTLLLEYAAAPQLAGLETVIVAGEACPPSLVEQHYHAVPGATLYNEYGPTEATVWSTVYRIPNRALDFVPIGRPIPNMEAYILDDALRPLPIGVPGELFVGGAGIASGYFERPDLTAERFIPHPFRPSSGGHLYRTGDRACYLPDGTIRFLGRMDDQIKLRGFRIEPGEIEALLLQQPGILAAAVLLHAPEEKRAPALDPDDVEGLATALASIDEPQALALLTEIESLLDRSEMSLAP